jgi:hypothetical protein
LLTSKIATNRRFQLILVKPSHYDDDGYVIRWWRSLIPSNSLAAIYGLALDSAQRSVLGPDVSIDIDVIDETNSRVDIAKLIRRRSRSCTPHGHQSVCRRSGRPP